jgi:hypothetical protein
MARLIRVDGTEETLNPPFSLKKLQELVGGYIQIIDLDNEAKERMVVNENGKLLNLETNAAATNYAEFVLLYDDYIVGNVLIISNEEYKSDE